MVAALKEDHKYLTVAVANATESKQKFELNVTGVRLAETSTLWQLAGSSLVAENHLGQPLLVEEREIPMGDGPGTISVAPATVNTNRLTVAPAQRGSVSNPTCCRHKTIK
jgi:alpha-L-arabinofuranosidase